MKFNENKGAIALMILASIAVGAWTVSVTLATLFLSIPVVFYSSWKHEQWIETFFEP